MSLTRPPLPRTCSCGVAGGCAYCRAIEIADDGPDLADLIRDPEPCTAHAPTAKARRTCGGCADHPQVTTEGERS